MKNRRVYGIDFLASSVPYINYGESKYAYVGWEEFLKFLPTI